MTDTLDLFQAPPEPAEPASTSSSWKHWGRGNGTVWYQLDVASHHVAVRINTTTGTWRASAMMSSDYGRNVAASGDHPTPHEALAELRAELQRLLDGIPDDTGLDAVAAKHGGRR